MKEVKIGVTCSMHETFVQESCKKATGE